MVGEAKRFMWTRIRAGHWSAYGYEIKRDRADDRWRILRDGEFRDGADSLVDAKRWCEQDRAKRLAKIEATTGGAP